MTFLWPWAFVLLPLPWLVRRLLPPATATYGAALRLPFFAQLQAAGVVSTARSRQAGWLQLLLMSLCWLLLVTAIARPAQVGEPVPLPVNARELLMAIDLSGSMGREDFIYNRRPVDRLSVVKAVADDFLSRRQGDRVGLILFSDRAYLQAPLTLDLTVVRQFLAEAQVGLTGRETAIGDAIGLAVKQLRERPASNRVLILLTDGSNNAGVLQPLQAAELARQEQVKIHTIGVGAASSRVGAMQDMDEGTLTAIAELTGGQYFRARNIQGLVQIYQAIDALEPVAGEAAYLRPITSLLHWPLAAALLLSLYLAAWRLGALNAVRVKARGRHGE